MKRVFLFLLISLCLSSHVSLALTPHMSNLLDAYYRGAYPDVIKFGDSHKPEERRLMILSHFAAGDYEKAALMQGASKDLMPMTHLIRSMKRWPEISMDEFNAALEQLPPGVAKRWKNKIFPPPPRVTSPTVTVPAQPDPVLLARKQVWQQAVASIVSGNEEAALQSLSVYTWDQGTDMDKMARYWKAMLLDKRNPEEAQRLRKKLMQDYPLGFYGLHIQRSFFPGEELLEFKSKNVSIDQSIWKPYTYGLGEIKAERLNEAIKNASSPAEKEKLVYSVATLYNKMNMPHRGVSVVEKNGYGLTGSNGILLKPFAKLLFPRPEWDFIQEEGKKKGIDPYLILALMRQESSFNPNATSRSGAAGYMQVMPATGKGIAKKLKLDWNGATTLYHPLNNIRIGTDYLDYLNQEFKGNEAYILAGYNGGPNATKRWLKKLQVSPATPFNRELFIAAIPYSETHDYVMKVLRNYWMYQKLYASVN